ACVARRPGHRDPRRLRARCLERAHRGALLPAIGPRLGRDRRSRRYPDHVVHEPGRLEGRARGVPAVSRCGHRQTVSRQSTRTPARRSGYHGGRCDGRGVRESRSSPRNLVSDMKACIVAVGSEMLTPFKTDTNSLHITEQLNQFGYDVHLKAIVGDDIDRVSTLLTSVLEWADLIMITGGLGPTEDDVTREAVAAAMNAPLEIDERI